MYCFLFLSVTCISHINKWNTIKLEYWEYRLGDMHEACRHLL